MTRSFSFRAIIRHWWFLRVYFGLTMSEAIPNMFWFAVDEMRLFIWPSRAHSDLWDEVFRQ